MVEIFSIDIIELRFRVKPHIGRGNSGLFKQFKIYFVEFGGRRPPFKQELHGFGQIFAILKVKDIIDETVVVKIIKILAKLYQDENDSI